MDELGVTDFQLHVLALMRAPDELAEPTLAILGADSVTMAERSDLIGRHFTIRPGVTEVLRAILSAAEILEGAAAEARAGDPVRYAFPAWPELEFEVSYAPSGMALHSAHFVRPRRPGPPQPVDVAPWSFLREDLPGAFEHIAEVDLWDTYASYTATDRSSHQRCFLRFAWGLLQEVSPMQ
ncbi:hypothetical protein [Kitasatospora sp. LaBMicrA B282]|uniref:hypothetical protein n=1 Tax=Kitasatospora sp. LaBMicrA B282 TaxID=3420949 RepID=UPI003D10EA3F